jgi:hypothetical protein
MSEPKIRSNYVRIIGEVEPGELTTKDRDAIRKEIDDMGAKAVVFNLKVKRPSQTKIPENIVGNDEAVIRKYAEDNLTGGLQLTKLIETGVKVYVEL